MVNDKKLSKKELKDDQLVDSFSHVLDFWRKYQTKIIIAIASLVVIIAVLVLYTNHMVNQNDEANGKIAKILKYYNGADYATAIDGRSGEFDGLSKIVSEYGSTEAGQIAKIYLANSLIRTGKFDEAYNMYDEYSGNKKLFQAAAKAGMAACKEAKGEFSLAAGLYKDAEKVTKNNPLNAEYLLKAGKAHLKAEENSKAQETFEKVKNEYRGSLAFSEADRYLQKIK